MNTHPYPQEDLYAFVGEDPALPEEQRAKIKADMEVYPDLAEEIAGIQEMMTSRIVNSLKGPKPSGVLSREEADTLLADEDGQIHAA